MNLMLILFLFTVGTGVFWVADMVFFARNRKKNFNLAVSALREEHESISPTDVERLRKNLMIRPWWLEWSAGLFGVLLAVFLLRALIGEPFRIPSASMMPTLVQGDFIAVNKITYGIKVPLLNKIVWRNNLPARGDVIVFRFPLNESEDYIKRIVGLPGDVVEYYDKNLTINGLPVSQKQLDDFLDTNSNNYVPRFEQTVDGYGFEILNYPPRRQGCTQFAVFPSAITSPPACVVGCPKVTTL